MSAAQSDSTLEAELEALQCHFTWDLDAGDAKLFRLRDKLEDIGTEEGYSWLGHIYNLQGYVHHQLGFTDDALRFFGRAAEAFRQVRNTVSDEGPWLVVNHGNLAWLHHHLGERADCRAYLSKVEALVNTYPSPSKDELHPEIQAEKAWTLMKFSGDRKRRAVECFQRAIRLQPDVLEWHSSRVLALVNVFKHGSNKEMEADVLEKIRIAKEHDPQNLYLAALYLEACAKNGRRIGDEARELARRVLKKPVSSYSGIKPLLRIYRNYVSADEAIDLAEEVLEKHPDERYLKRCAALCYKERIFSHKDNPLERSMMDRAISLCREVIPLYPQSSHKIKIALANMYAKSGHEDEAEQTFQELLESDLDLKARQILYNSYAKYLHLIRKESYKSIEYHMRAAEVPLQSVYREDSVAILQRITERNRNRMCRDVEQFLANLQD